MWKCIVIGAFGNYGGVAACIASRNYQVQIMQDELDLHPIEMLRHADPNPYKDLIETFNRDPRLRLARGTNNGQSFEEFRFGPATSDYASLVDADVLLLAVPSLFHEAIGTRLREVEWKKPLTLVTFTDRSLGAYACWHAAGKPSAWRLVGVNATPYFARKHHTSLTFHILGLKKSLLFATYPRGTDNEARHILESLLPGYEGEFCLISSMLDLAMSSNPALLHAVHELSILNRILAGKNVQMYDEANFGPEVESCILKVCAERMKIAEAYRVTAQFYIDYEKSTYTTSVWGFGTIRENRNTNPLFRGMLSPIGLRHAKGVESVCCSFCLWESMAQHGGIEVPTISKVIDQWSKQCKIDFRRFGRNLQNLGLKEYAKPELAAAFQ